MAQFIVIGNTPDNSTAIDIADYLGQEMEIADQVSLKTFSNGEFCPRFTLTGKEDIHKTGIMLEGYRLILVSTHNNWLNRNELALRNLVLARAAKDNAAKEVILVEPDLFYSAQDRGPRNDQGETLYARSPEDYHKFNGQPFTARLYAQLLKKAGVDRVITVHNHSHACIKEYENAFGTENITNLFPDSLYHYYITCSGLVDPAQTILAAPDEGARDFVMQTAAHAVPNYPVLLFSKKRMDEKTVELSPSKDSPVSLHETEGKDVVVLDDMVRSGNTLQNCCHIISKYRPRKIVGMITHFYPSGEIKHNLNVPFLNRIITTNTIPTILTRDNQGRLRKKMTVLKLNKWLADQLDKLTGAGANLKPPYYREEMPNRNSRPVEV